MANVVDWRVRTPTFLAGLFADDLDAVADQLDRAFMTECGRNADCEAPKPVHPGCPALVRGCDGCVG